MNAIEYTQSGSPYVLVDYAKTKHAGQVRTLFREIYPEWDEITLDRMSYDEKDPFHIKTKLVFENNLIIAQANAFWISKEQGIANLGYHVHPRYQKKGIGYQITKALLDELREEVNCFVILTTHDNIASQRLCEKLGFTNPSSKIYDTVSNTDKIKKIKNPYFKALIMFKTDEKEI